MRRLLTGLIFILVLINTGWSQPQPGLDTALYVEALVKYYDTEPDSRYLGGYRWDRVLRRREFRQPVSLIPLEIYYGIGYFGGGGKNLDKMPHNWMSFEQQVENLSSKQAERVYQRLDVDLMRTNLSHYILKTSWADISTGLNLNFSSLFGPAELPTETWGATQASWNPGERFFAPRIIGAGISNAIILQWDSWWYLNFRYSYGLASAKFYRNSDNEYDPDVSGWGQSVAYDVGVKFILDARQTIRYSFGVSLRHSFTRIDRIKDPGDITPVSGIKMPGFGIYLTLSAFYGGTLTDGDIGKQFYYRRDYVSAKDKLGRFLAQYPKHANRRRAKQLIDKCNQYIPGQLYREGRQFENDGNMKLALNRYQMAQVKADSNLNLVIEAAYERIAVNPLSEARSMADLLQVQQALDLVTETSAYSKTAQSQLPGYRAQASIHRGKVAFKYQFYSMALREFDNAVQYDPETKVEVDQLRLQVAAALIRQANDIDDPEAIQLAVQSLEKAQELMGGLSKESTIILEQLKERMGRFSDVQLQRHIDRRMAEARDKLFREQVNVQEGMTIPQVQELLGEPTEIVHRVNREKTDYQLWIYRIDKKSSLELTFQDYILFKIERP